MFTAKDIVIDSYDRTGIFPNASNGLPGDFFTMGLSLLKGLVSQYNIRNYLTFTQQKVNFVAAVDMTLGTNDSARSILNDVSAPNCSTIQKAYLKNSLSGDCIYEMTFVSFQDFLAFSGRSGVFSWRQINDLQFALNFPTSCVGEQMEVYYNEKVIVSENSEYAIGDEYRELWTLGLSDKLLTYYPRKDDAMKQYIASELAAAISNITAKNAANRIILSNTFGFNRGSSLADFNSGSWMR